ncbi:MAG TPA: ATP-binding cassette domain-containing protein [Thermoanaerobaculia bacterium]
MAEPILEAAGLGRRAPGGGPWLLRGVSLALAPGDRLAVEGPTGAGKTVLLRALALLDPVDEGEVRFRGRSPADREVPAFRRRVAYLHQSPALAEGTVEENLRLPFRLAVHRNGGGAGAGARFERARAVELLAALGRDEGFLGREREDLSGGERQIVALVRLLQLEPEVLLLDEPTAALDPTTTGNAEELLSAWAAAAGRAWIWVSHDAEQGARLADRRLRLAGGRIEGGV